MISIFTSQFVVNNKKRLVLYLGLYLVIFHFIVSCSSDRSSFIESNGTKSNNERKKKFKLSFDNHCKKYSFVNRWTELLESKISPEKFFIFIYQEEGVKTGGMGDRFAGIVSAVALSIR